VTADGAGHWFDRLAVTLTRRQALKGAAGLAGAALGFAAVRPHAALAAAPNLCETGCRWTAQTAFYAQTDGSGPCWTAGTVITLFTLPGVLITFGLGDYSTLAGAYNHHKVQNSMACLERAMADQKAAFWDCHFPGCSGFDPKQKGGPCETCTSNVGDCCADPTTVTGYSCCALGCACGSDTGGCHSGSTPC